MLDNIRMLLFVSIARLTASEGNSLFSRSINAAPISCEDLASAVGASTILCGENVSTYTWDTYNERCTMLTPAAIVMITEAAHVQQAVSFAHKHARSISVRGVGHSYNCMSMKKDSLMLDMRSMGNAVTYLENPDGTAYAQFAPGVNFIHVAETLPENYSFTHGTCPTVGVYGYHLHGGWGLETASWANESIRELQVVIANGTLLTLNSSSQGSEAALLRAMRVAGSSFGIVTSMTIQLFSHQERPKLIKLVENSFEELLAVITDPAHFTLPFGWIGLARWDGFFQFPNGQPQGWSFQAILKDDEVSTRHSFDKWANQNNIKITGDLEQRSWASMSVGNYNVQTNGTFPDSSTFSRLYEFSEFPDAATLLLKFFDDHLQDCRIQVGPLKSYDMFPIVTLECLSHESITALSAFVDEHADVLKADKPGSGYVNLPLDASRKYNRAYYPQYDELAAVKAEWDPCNFFYIENGIHAPAGSCKPGPSVDVQSLTV